MERFSENDKKLSLLILLLVGLFVLNACGSRDMAQPRNIDDRKNWDMQKNTLVYKKPVVTNPDNGNTPGESAPDSGEATEILEPTFVNGKVTYKASSGVFTPLELIADPKTNHVSFNTEINIGKVKKTLTLEGSYTRDGVASIVHSKEKKNNKDIGVAAVRCIGGCENLIADIVIKKIDQDGVESYEQTQFEIPVKQMDDNGTPIDKTQSPLIPTTAPAQTPVTNSAPEAESKKPGPILKKPTTSDGEDEGEDITGEVADTFQSAIPDDVKENLEPFINLSKKPEASKPQVPIKVTPSSASHYASMEGVNLTLFPSELGDMYPGKAVGCYAQKLCDDRCHFQKLCDENKKPIQSALYVGTDIVNNRVKDNDAYETGVRSIELSKTRKVIFASGLLKKHVQEVGRLYAKKYSGERFETTNVAIKGGGNTGGDLAHQNGLEIDVLLPRTKKGTVDYSKLMSLINMFDSYGLIDRFFLDISHIRNLCKYADTQELKKSLSKVYHIRGHKNHFHVRDKCTIEHNPSCVPIKYESYDNGVHC